VPLTFLSAHGDVPAAINAMQQGVIDFPQKPLNSQAFLNSVYRIVRLAPERFDSKQHDDGVRHRFDHLSARELEVLHGLLEGKTSEAMAREPGMSPKTVDVHRASVMRKLLVSNGAELVKLVGSARVSVGVPTRSGSRLLHWQTKLLALSRSVAPVLRTALFG
jgi:FixJ family two-component response regulator